uniref:Uncharacterized protein n=1 Tax=candidate division CPR3 bacterium TaxID=2268181 RepID=A0A7V3JAM7_UNCC3
MNYGGFNYTNFRGINLKNTAAIRLEMDGGLAGTLSVKSSPDASRAWQFPDKSGTFGVTGTFTVSVPYGACATSAVYSTVVTVPGVRAEDAIVCTLQDALSTAGIALVGAVPGNGSVTLYFSNTSGATLNVLEKTVAYTIAR